MLETALTIALSLLTLAWLLNLYRLIAGPSLPDRVLALDRGQLTDITERVFGEQSA